MNWFRRLTGFDETSYAETQEKLSARHGVLRSAVNGAEYQIGTFEMVPLADLRAATTGIEDNLPPTTVSIVRGDISPYFGDSEYVGALFQAASQFNALEMPAPWVTPEDGVSDYEYDHTQGPACAMAAGAATIYRNYLVPVGGQIGQRANRQLDGLCDLGPALAAHTGLPVERLWRWLNGYALLTADGSNAINRVFADATPDELQELAGLLRIGLHRDVEVTSGKLPGQIVSQAFCSALPFGGYGDISAAEGEVFARFILSAAYEATLRAGLESARRGGSNIVVLTMLGGGVFGNRSNWIEDAIKHALTLTPNGLDIRINQFSAISPGIHKLTTGVTR